MVTELWAAAQLAWGLMNSGAPQPLTLDHYTVGNIPGVIGEDIRPLSDSDPRFTVPRNPVIVAVLDTGVDAHHPQLKDALELPGFNAILSTSDVTDVHGHGTHVSGIIAARGDFSGFHGVSRTARILPIKVVQTGPNAPIKPQDLSGDAGTALTQNVARGMMEAVKRGAQVIHLSLSWPSSIHSTAVDEAVAFAKSHHALIVSSAGNDSTEAEVYPCIYEEVICVGSHGPDGAISHFSNFGPMVDLLAPGISILSAWPLNKSPTTFVGQVGYEYRNGTSMAAPFVSGALAELISLGWSPEEARARILVGARSPRAPQPIKTEVQSEFDRSEESTTKMIRFGNLDLTRAASVSPQPLILPVNKGVISVEWDGVKSSILVPVSWRNHWIRAQQVVIEAGGRTYRFNKIEPGQVVTTPVLLNLGNDPDSELNFSARVLGSGVQPRNFTIRISIFRRMASNQIPPEAKGEALQGISLAPGMELRSIVSADGDLQTRSDWLLTQDTDTGIRLSLIQGRQWVRDYEAPLSNLLKIYRLPDASYRAVFLKMNSAGGQPSFIISQLSAQFVPVSTFELGGGAPLLPENLVWDRIAGEFTPLWIAYGFTPKADLPPFDPWNADRQDLKIPRVFLIESNELRCLSLANDQLPLQILPDHRILVARGSAYFQKYEILTQENGLITKTESLDLPQYRMLVGLNPGSPALSFQADANPAFTLTGASSPGNLRVSFLEGHTLGEDQILLRPSALDALVSVPGAFRAPDHSAFFVESHFDLIYYSSKLRTPLSTSLHRYSYIPSLIFSHSRFPVLLKSEEGQNLAGMYTPASLANDWTSEVLVADEASKKVKRPARFHFKTDESCQALGDLIPATPETPAQQVWICGNQQIKLPLTIRK